MVDSGVGQQTANIERRRIEKPVIIDIDSDGNFTDNIYFTPNYYIYAGQVVTGIPGNYVGIANTKIEFMIGDGLITETDLNGSFGFGLIPETWPVDGEKYKVRIQKNAFEAKIEEVAMTLDRNSELILLEKTADEVELSGIVVSKENGQPVSTVAIDFGNGQTTISETNGNFGPLTIPIGTYIARMNKYGFETTEQTLSDLTEGATNITLEINGGQVSTCGEIYDSKGYPITNASILIIEESSGLKFGSLKTKENGSMSASRLWYYDLPVAKGKRKYSVSAPGYLDFEVELDIDGHTKQDIVLVPEPIQFLIFNFLFLISFLRRK